MLCQLIRPNMQRARIVIASLVVSHLIGFAVAINNGAGLTPAMGYKFAPPAPHCSSIPTHIYIIC